MKWLGILIIILSIGYYGWKIYMTKNYRKIISGKAINVPHYVGIATVKPPRPPSRLMYNK